MQARHENDFDYFSRRAMEESHAAAGAECQRTSAAHRRLAAVYATKLRDEKLVQQDFSKMLGEIDLLGDS